MVLPYVDIENSSCILGCYPIHKDTFHHFAQSVHYYHYIDAVFSLKITADGEINYEIDRNMNPFFIRYWQWLENTVVFIF